MRSLDKKWRVIIITAVSVVVLVVGTFFIIKNKANKSYLAGVEAHRALDASAAIEHYQEVLTYPEFLGSFIEDTAVKLGETQAYEDANTLWASGKYPEAQDAFTSFLIAYPASVFNEKSYHALLDIPFEWAEKLFNEENYEGAADIYDQVIKDDDLPDAIIDDAKKCYFDTYTSWASSEFQAKAYNRAETLFTDLISWTTKTDPSRKTEAQTLLGETYIDWGDILFSSKRYLDAITKYKSAGSQDISGLTARAEENIGAVYLDWGENLVRTGDLSDGGEKYGLLLLAYDHTQAFKQITNQACEPLISYGEYLLTNSIHDTAEKIFSFALSLIEDGQEELQAVATYDLGQAYHGQKLYFDSVSTFDEALTLTESEILVEDISTFRQTSIDGIGQLTDSMGETIMFVVYNDIIEFREKDPLCFTGGSSKKCLTEEELEIAYLAVGQDEEEKRHILYFERGGKQANLPNEIEAIRPGHFRYASFLVKSERKVQTCPYSSTGYGIPTHHIVRWQKKYAVSMYDTLTGKRVGYKEFAGTYPKTCPRTYSFGSSLKLNWYGDEPKLQDVYDWLARYAK